MPIQVTVVLGDEMYDEAYNLVRSLPGKISYEISVVELDEKKPKKKVSDRSQLIIIWLLATVTILAVFLFLEWSTRP